MGKMRWLQAAILSNPVVYMSEGLRAAVIRSMPYTACVGGADRVGIFSVAPGGRGSRDFRVGCGRSGREHGSERLKS